MATNPPDRITVTLIPKTRRALDELGASSGMSATDLINRAVQLYAFVQEQAEDGNDLALRRKSDGSVAPIHLV